MTWIVKYGGSLVDRFHIGKDGRTSYFRRKGKNTHPILVPIFEKILYKPLEKAGRNKFEEQIVKIILAPLKECSFGSRTLERLPLEKRWDYEYVCSVNGTPWDPVPRSGEPVHVFMDPKFVEGVPENIVPRKTYAGPVIRRVRLTPHGFQVYGFTPGCPVCNAIRNGTFPRGHTDQCRDRMESNLCSTSEGRKRVQQAEERMTKIVARQLEQQDKDNSNKRARIVENTDSPLSLRGTHYPR